jgi:hypothetical protein
MGGARHSGGRRLHHSIMSNRPLRTTIGLAAFAVSLSAGPASGQRIGEPEQSSREAPVVRLASLSPRDARVHEPLWSLAAPAAPALDNARAPVVTWHGTAFLATVRWAGAPDAPLKALVERTGKTRWTSAFSAQPMAASDGLVYAAGARGIVAFDVATGALRWTAPGVWVQIVDRVAIISTGERLEARDAATGRLRWSARWIGYARNVKPDIVPDGVNAVGTTLLAHTVEHGATTTGFEYAYDLRDGRALWKMQAYAFLGNLAHDAIALDTTWAPASLAGYAPLHVSVVALATGAVREAHAYAPDPKRWKQEAEREADVQFANERNEVAIDGDALVFRIGPATVYRYPIDADPDVVLGTSYELGALKHLGGNTWLASTTDGEAGLAHLGPRGATLQKLAGLHDVAFTGVYGGYALVLSPHRATVFAADDPRGAVTTRFPCPIDLRSVEIGGSFPRVVLSEGALVVACRFGGPANRVVALALPQRS